MEHKAYICTESPMPELDEREHTAFFMHLQRAILASLEERELLTASERALCISSLERRYSKKRKNERQA